MVSYSELGISHNQQDKKESIIPLPREALINVISALGNDESKLITVSAMEPGVFYGQRGLARRIETFLNGYPNPYVGKGNFATYCEKSFSPVDIVSRKIAQDDRVYPEFGITPLGARTGVALAGHLLSFSEAHAETSLRKLSGNNTAKNSTAKAIKTAQEDIEPNKKSLETRYKIFYELLTASLPIRMIDLAQALDENPTVLKQHIDHLRENGVVVYESIDSIQPIVLYRPSNSKPTQEFFEAQRSGILTHEIYELVQKMTSENESSWVTIEDIISHTPVRQTGKYKNGMGGNATRSTVLKRLADAGYLTRKQFSGNMRSEISLAEQQTLLLNEFVSLIDRFQNQDEDFIKEGIKKAQQILADPSRVYALMTKAKDSSPNTDPVPMETMKRAIIQVLPEDREINAADLSLSIQGLLGKKLSDKHIRTFLVMLADEGRINCREDNRRKYWSLNPTQS